MNGQTDQTANQSLPASAADGSAQVLGFKSKPSRALRPDAQPFDEIRIVTVPRYKTSGMSGDEWRISAKIEFYRKGILKAEKSYSNIAYAVRYLDWAMTEVCENGSASYGGEENFCDQEGCSEQATVTYRLKARYCREGHKTEPHGIEIRKFCDRHKTRGDCGLDDADDNYELFATQATE